MTTATTTANRQLIATEVKGGTRYSVEYQGAERELIAKSKRVYVAVQFITWEQEKDAGQWVDAPHTYAPASVAAPFPVTT